MKNLFKLSVVLVAASLAFSSCNCFKKMAKHQDEVNVTCTPEILALNNGGVSAAISFLRTLAFQVIAILLLPLLLGIDGIWLAVTAAELAALAVSAAMLLTKDKVFHYRKA